jgi:cytochrome c-type biogenesis protein
MIVMINGSYLQGVQLLIAYSMGLAVPFLFAALGLGWVTGLIKKHSATLRYIQIVMGGILIILGLLLVFGLLEQMARISPIFNFGI